MNLRWLEDFIALCETRSFTEAAQRRFLTQSALSKHIQALEAWLGSGALLNRSTSPIEITSVGQVFKGTALQIVSLLNSARRTGSDRTATQNIYVSATHSLSSTFVPLLSKLLCENLSIQTICLNVAANNFREALLRYERAECDYFLCYNSPINNLKLDSTGHIRLTLGTDYLVPVSIPSTQNSKPYYAITRASERPLPYLAYAEESHLGRVLQSHASFLHFGSRLIVRAKSAYAETLRAGVLNGLGIAWLPCSLIKSNLENGDVVLATDDDAYYIPLTIDIYRQSRISREEVLKCWEIWQAHILSMSSLMPQLLRPAEHSRTIDATIQQGLHEAHPT